MYLHNKKYILYINFTKYDPISQNETSICYWLYTLAKNRISGLKYQCKFQEMSEYEYNTVLNIRTLYVITQKETHPQHRHLQDKFIFWTTKHTPTFTVYVLTKVILIIHISGITNCTMSKTKPTEDDVFCHVALCSVITRATNVLNGGGSKHLSNPKDITL